MNTCRSKTLWIPILVGLTATALQVAALVEPRDQPLSAKEFRHAVLTLPEAARPLLELKAEAAARSHDALARLGITSEGARVDTRSGRFDTLLPSHPLISARTAPGKSGEQRAAAARDAFTRFLDIYRAELGVDTAELGAGRVTVHGDGSLIQIHLPQVVDGIPVRGSYVSGVINHGKLNLFGTHLWGDVGVSTRPKISAGDALAVAAAHLAPYEIEGSWNENQLVLVPTAEGENYGHRLAWQVHPRLRGEVASFELLVDAHSGELLSAEDANLYAEVKGGVYPVSNDGNGPDGVEQAGWPMPLVNVMTSAGTQATDTGGNVVAIGSMTSNLEGPLVRIDDHCGSISLTQPDGIDFGTSGGDDCTTPGYGGTGNTHASRTGFYELNKIKEMALGWLPNNRWLHDRLTANVNIDSVCNAFWNYSTINFYRSGSGCGNTGEIAGILDHEWGHGMDTQDAGAGIAFPSGEGIADLYAALRLNDSCIGRGFRSTVCSGDGDPCLSCTGVRDIDYLKRQSGQPHDYSWARANCGSSVHCLGAVYSEAVWSLWKRELQQAPYDYDNNTAHEIVNRLTYLGGGLVYSWFRGGPPFGGCHASDGYLNYLAVDDDDGDLGNGTPHMTAIYNAFNDQEIACDTPPVQDSGCAGKPSAAPVVSASPGNRQIDLSWEPVPGASEYQVFRTEGVFACDFGKAKIGETAATSWNDSGLRNGRDYSYVVIPMGASDACFGPASACATATPAGGPDFELSCNPSSLVIARADDATATCTVISGDGYTGDVGLSCSGGPAGVGCSFAPPSVPVPADGGADSTLMISVDPAQATGTFVFDVAGDDGIARRTLAMKVEVVPEGTQQAVYSPMWEAPWCRVAGSSCHSGGLLDGRAHLGPEPNQPNTLDGCLDGVRGSYHFDESNDRIVVSTLDGADFEEGATVRIDATVWAWPESYPDTLLLYYAADASDPNWVYITSIVPPAAGAQTLSAQYTLPAGDIQAVRASFHAGGIPELCEGGYDHYSEADDLVFTVRKFAPTLAIVMPGDGTIVTEGTAVFFAGTAGDFEDGELSSEISWTSSLDGALGTGAILSTASLSAGIHSISASVTDSSGLSASDQITVVVAGSSAAPIAVANFSFETPALAYGDWTPAITSWTQISGVTGTFEPTSLHFLHGVPHDENTAYMNGGTIAQTITAETLLADTTYTLIVGVGRRMDRAFPGYAIQLLVDGVVRASADETSWSPRAGTFAAAAASFTTEPADAGRPLEIRLSSSGEQVNFDNVRLTRSVYGDSVPAVTIDSPADGSSFPEGASVPFVGTAIDAEDGDLGSSLSWTSNRDGPIGSGRSFSTSSLSCGVHAIEATVSDSGGLAGHGAVTVAVTRGETVPIAVDNFSFETPDLEDGDWTHSMPSWVRIDGTSGIFDPTAQQFSGGVPEGDNSAYLNGGTIGQTVGAEALHADSIYTLEVDVGNRTDRDFPGYEIQLLVDGVVRARADETSVSPADGAFATATARFMTTPADAGRSLEIRLLAPGGAQPNFDNVRLTRSACGVNTPPAVAIEGPADGWSCPAGGSVSFAGTATDAEDGDCGSGLVWTSSLDGPIGFGPELSTSGLSCGVHTITASVTDSGGLSGSDAITLTVGAIAVENANFEEPPLDDGDWTHNIPSWSKIDGVSGVFDPTSTQFPDGVPAGENSAYINGGAIGQEIVAETLVAGSAYEVSVDVGDRADKPFPGYEIQLLVNGVVRGSADETAVSPLDGAFATATVSFTAAPADAGQSLEIRLLADGEQPNFDNVRLRRSTCD